MVIGLLEAELSIPESRSLKDKRMVIRSLKDRLVARMNVSVAEVGRQDEWRRAEMAFVTVAARKEVAEKRIAEVRNFLELNPRHVLLDVHTEFL